MKFKGLLVGLVAGLICLPFLSYGEDLAILRQRAEQGNAEAQYRLGNAYIKGDGVPKDYEKATKLWNRAAMQRHAGAQYNLGLAYARGTGVPKDYEKAYAWVTVAADQDQGRTRAAELKSRLLKDMTSDQISKGTQLSKEYAKKFGKQGTDQSGIGFDAPPTIQNEPVPKALEKLDLQRNELTQKAFEKLDLQIEEKKLSKKECEKISGAPKTGSVFGGKEINIYNDYNGRIYSLEFINRGGVDIKNLKVECRFYYVTTKSWRVYGGFSTASKTKIKDQKFEGHFDYSFNIPVLSPEAGYTTETAPFVLVSSHPPSGYYRMSGGAEVVESRPRGLWVRVFRTAADGSKTHIDFCDPPNLSSKVTR